MSHAIPLGAYILDRPLGRGAMGEVWAGRHLVHNVPVAIKILTAPHTRDDDYEASFREEVRAAAGLDHPNVVMIYDLGRVPRETTQQTQGRYPENRPYLVMELVEGVSLARRIGKMNWPELYRVLLALLDALGHAHARGIVHRDLKPQNVMQPKDPKGPAIKLTDFGLAHARARRETDLYRDHLVGTPNYMAPEQIQCRWRDLGPWTDLYALGCCAWALLTGEPPFKAKGARAILEGHLHHDLPTLDTPDAPSGFERWLHRLLEKDPGRRYQRAADAAWALLELTEGRPTYTAEEAAPTRLMMPAVDLSQMNDPTQVISDVQHTLNWSPEDWEQDLMLGREAPPTPSSWIRAENLEWLPLVGAGLGLFGLRKPPFVGRIRERNAIWNALRDVRRLRSPQAIVLRGQPGQGKSSLAAWICERAHEFGAAEVLRITHAIAGSPRDGLAAMLVRHHALSGLDRSEAAIRLHRILSTCGAPDLEVAHQLAEILLPASTTEGIPPSTSRRYRLIGNHLRQLARQRPLLVWIDDAQWGLDTLGFIQAMLGAKDLDLLFLITVEAGADPDVEGQLQHIADHQRGEAITLKRMPEHEMAQLVHGQIGLDRAVATEVQARSEGNPLFAVQLIGDWVQRGALVAGPDGFELNGAVPRRVPDGLPGIWWRRVVQAVPDADAFTAVELAAVLGRDIDMEEWLLVLEGANLATFAGAAFDGLRGAGLVRRLDPTHPDWRFSHAMLQEALIQQAKDQGRLEGHHRLCAAALKGRSDLGIAERRTHHLIGAGLRSEAVRPLAQAVRDRLNGSEFAAAHTLFDQWQALVSDVRLPPADARRGEGWLLTCRMARVTGDLERARKLAHAAISEGERFGWPRVIARSYVDLAWDAVRDGEWATGIERLSQAATYAEQVGDHRLLANCRRNQAAFLLDRGDPRKVRALLDQTLEIYRSLDHAPGLALTYLNRAQLARRQGEFTTAETDLNAAREHFTQVDAAWGLAMVLSERGLVAQDRGELDEALAHHRRAVAQYTVIGGVNQPRSELYLARTHLARGEHAKAKSAFTRLRPGFEQNHRHALALFVDLGEMVVAAAEGQWAVWDQLAANATERVMTRGLKSLDGARLAETAATTANPVRTARSQALARMLRGPAADLSS